jgi:hypothetical protein
MNYLDIKASFNYGYLALSPYFFSFIEYNFYLGLFKLI